MDDIRRNKLSLRLHSILDLFLTIAAFIWAYFIKKYFLPSPFQGLTESPNYYIVLLLIIIIWYVLFEAFGLYSSYLKKSFSTIFFNLLKAVSTSNLILILIVFLFGIKDVSRILMGIFFLFNFSFLTVSKYIIYRKLTNPPKSLYRLHNILIVGSRERAKDVICAIEGERDNRGRADATCSYLPVVKKAMPKYKIFGCIDVDDEAIGKTVINGYKVMATLDSFQNIVLENPIDEIFIAMPLHLIRKVEQHIAFAGKIGIPVRIIPDWQIKDLIYNPAISFIEFEVFSGLATIILSAVPPSREALLIKSGIDYIFAAVALVFLFPLFLLIAIAIKISSRGPIFYKQSRAGRNGRIFDVYKFRTMIEGADKMQKELEAFNEAEGPVFKIKKDPRIIPYVGTFLRRTFIDELPQLINVLKGEMSLIGPRPPIPSEVEKYEIWQRRRLSMKPGMTCLWQISPKKHNMSFDEWMRLDLLYIDTWSPALDAKIFLNTLMVMLWGTGR